MRGHKRLFGALVALMATIAMVCSMAGPAYADRYSYTVRVFQGNGGKLKSDPVSVKVDKGGRVNLFDFATADVSDSKYVQIGFRLSGEDEIIGNGIINGVIERGQATGKYGSGITQDMDFVVAYGVKGETVEYTLRFVEYGTGRELAEPQTYYGRVGDKPVVAYEYIEGYRPLYLSITGTLKENPEENVWTFEYVALQEGETTTPGTTTTNTTTTNTPGNETVTNEGTTYEPGTTTTTTRTETVPGTTTNEPTTTTGTTTSPSTTGGTTTTSPTSTGGGTTTSPSGTTTTTTTTVPTNTTTTTNAGGNTATSTPSNAGGNDAASTAPSGAGNAGDAGNAGNAGATANDGGGGAGTGGGAADGGNAGASAQESAPATQEILDMDTPLAGPSSSDTGSLADAATSNTHTNSYARAGILLALLIAAALAAGFYIWKRKQEDSEDEPEPEE